MSVRAEPKEVVAEPDAELVGVLENLLARARAGEMVGLAGVYANGDGSSGSFRSVGHPKADPTRLLGQVWMLGDSLRDYIREFLE